MKREQMLTAGEVAKLLDVSVCTVRHREKFGRLPPSTRNSAGCRRWPRSVIEPFVMDDEPAETPVKTVIEPKPELTREQLQFQILNQYLDLIVDDSESFGISLDVAFEAQQAFFGNRKFVVTACQHRLNQRPKTPDTLGELKIKEPTWQII